MILTEKLIKEVTKQFDSSLITDLDLSSKQLTSISSSKQGRNKKPCPQIVLSALQLCQNLKSLDLSRNMLTSVEGLERLGGHLLHLNLSFNRIRYLPKYFLGGARGGNEEESAYILSSPSLVSLRLEGNMLQSLQDLEFLSSLKELRKLSLKVTKNSMTTHDESRMNTINPVCREDNYASTIVTGSSLSKLEILDGEFLSLKTAAGLDDKKVSMGVHTTASDDFDASDEGNSHIEVERWLDVGSDVGVISEVGFFKTSEVITGVHNDLKKMLSKIDASLVRSTEVLHQIKQEINLYSDSESSSDRQWGVTNPDLAK